MTKTLVSVFAAVQDIIGAVSGIRSAPDYVPGSPGPGVTSVVFYETGTIDSMSDAWIEGHHNIVVQIACPRGADLPKTLKTLYPFGDSIPDALFDDVTLSSTVDTIEAPIRISFGGINWTNPPGSEPSHLGWTFTIPVKIVNTL